MDPCTHDLSSEPLTVFSSCQFQKISAIITLGGRADVVCGVIDAIEPPKQVAVKGFRPIRGVELVEPTQFSVYHLPDVVVSIAGLH
ncbi:hypothetical protein BDV93DRAFT_373240 [Ceratobasidium sp. AG-I]|nr:hypothetical protein BDV93DRAFT_373240 [Ceratobasidium sp. AG-I]